MAPSLHTFTTDTSFLALDGDTLKLREQRFRYQHRLRLIQAQSRLPATASRVLTALPLLLHFNHPALPGYAGHQSPAGIHRFSTSPAAIKHIQHFAPGFAPPSSAFEARQPQIDAVYFMGSVGSVAQTRASDIDIWVCLPAQHHAHMEQKLSVISRWAKGLGVDLQCFCVDASISTPRDKPFWRLLLDEFYRTGCWLAGKIPLWWLMPNIPDEQHTAWATAVQEFMPLNSTIDFGPVAEFTSLELYAATIEELARAIHNPYKALLKIALLESYANGMPSLSAHYKSEVLQRANAPLVDSYVLLAEQLEQFFSRFSIPLRRDFMRRAWLTKTTRANARLGLNGAWWAFAQRWGYSRQQVEHLRWPAQWSLAELVDENHRVIAAFAHALSFATSLKPPASANPHQPPWNEQHSTLAEVRHIVMTHTQYGNKLLHALVPPRYKGQSSLALRDNLWQLAEGRHVILRRQHLLEVLLWLKQQSLTLKVLLPAQRDDVHLRQLYFSLSAPRPLLFVNPEHAMRRGNPSQETGLNEATTDNPLDDTTSSIHLLTDQNQVLAFATLFDVVPKLVQLPQIYHAAAIDRRDERRAVKLIELSRAARRAMARNHAFIGRLQQQLCCLVTNHEGSPTLSRYQDAWDLWTQAPAARFEVCPASIDVDLSDVLGDFQAALMQPGLIIDFNKAGVMLAYRDPQRVLVLPLPQRPTPQLVQSMRLFIASQKQRQLTIPQFYQRGDGSPSQPAQNLQNLFQDNSWGLDTALRYRLIFQQQERGWQIVCGRETLFRRDIDLKTLASIKRRVLAHRTTRDDYPVYITDVSTRRNTFVANLVAKVAIEQALQTSEPQQALNAMRALGDPADN